MSIVKLIDLDDISYRTYHEESPMSGINIVPSQCFEEEIEGIRVSLPLGKLRDLEKSSGCRIVYNKAKAQVRIHGFQEQVVPVKAAIMNLIDGLGKGRDGITHFISTPLNLTGGLTSSFESFKSFVVALSPGLERAFVSERKLHLTITILSLESSEKVESVVGILASQLQQSSLMKPLSIRLRGLKILKGTPEACKLLYANPEIPSQLHEFSQSLLNVLVKEGFATDLSVMWHCTLANSKYGGGQAFDVKSIIDVISDFDFGIAEIDQIHLSVMNPKSDNSGGKYYKAEHIFSIK